VFINRSFNYLDFKLRGNVVKVILVYIAAINSIGYLFALYLLGSTKGWWK